MPLPGYIIERSTDVKEVGATRASNEGVIAGGVVQKTMPPHV